MAESPITNTVLYLVGPPGVGKMTVGGLLAQKLDAHLIHNHLWLNPIFGVIEQDGITPLPARVWDLAAQVRAAVFAAAKTLTPPSWNLIFTHGAVGNSEADVRLAAEIIDVARVRNARLAVVQLTCAPEELARRVSTPSRRDHMKDVDAKAALVNAALPPFSPKHPSIVRIDTTHLDPEDAANEVFRQIQSTPGIVVP